MKKEFYLPSVELIAFQNEDIICTSSDPFYGQDTDISVMPDGSGAIII